jgi:predicted transcriptional regulator
MAKKTRDALEILDRLTGDAPQLREMIAEETVAAYKEGFELTEEQQEEIAQALAEADRGEGVDGWQFLAELRRS